jgi:hypothetical protein
MTDALQVESNALELSFPELRDLEHTGRTPAEWKGLFHRFAKQVTEWTTVSDPPSPGPKSPEELEESCRRLFPNAKQMLIDSGLPPAEVYSMSVHQVALLYTLSMYHKIYDDGAKNYSLPYPEAIQGIDEAIGRFDQTSDEPQEIIPVASHALKALRGTRNAIARNDRQIASLRVFEALRLHAGANGGRLPERLSDITIVPLPVDPVTGKPFEYRLADGKALLSGPPLPHAPLRYEITMQSP